MDVGILRDVGPCEMQHTHIGVKVIAIMLDPKAKIRGMQIIDGLRWAGVVSGRIGVAADGILVDEDTVS